MINARSIATLGIGFGVVAITTLGIVSVEVEQPAVVLPDRYGASRLEWHDPQQFTEQDLAIVQFIVSFVINEG